MFFITYLRRELRRRIRQATFIALGLALGIGLVVTVSAASAGVKKAQADVLSSLYGVGTDITVTGSPPQPGLPTGGPPKNARTITVSPGGAQECQNGKCHNLAGTTMDNVIPAGYNPFSQSRVGSVRALKEVRAAAGALILTDNKLTFPKHFGAPGSSLPSTNSLNVDGVDTSHLSLGPLTSGTITSGRSLRSSDSSAYVAVVDSNYAVSHKLKVGGTITVGGTRFTVVGVVRQPQSGSPPDAYIPLARAQALKTVGGSSLRGQVNEVYVTAASAADITAVQTEIRKLLPKDTVTTAAGLASEATGSAANAAKLADDLGRWLSVLVLLAAFAVASLLTMAAVSRRVAEFGTLKALGWRSSRIIAQVMGESAVTGLLGAVAGVGLGFAGAAIIDAVAPKLSATIASSASGFTEAVAGPGGAQRITPSVSHTVMIPMSASVTTGAIVLGVVLAVLGGLLAGSFGGWRIARLRPTDALTRVA